MVCSWSRRFSTCYGLLPLIFTMAFYVTLIMSCDPTRSKTNSLDPKCDCGEARHLRLITSAHHNLGSSFLSSVEIDEDEGASRASFFISYYIFRTPRNHSNYPIYDFSSLYYKVDDLLFERQTELLNQSQEIHKELEVDLSHSKRHCEESSARKRSEDVE
ncbi:hypothetical protein Tco_0070614 [Tanacetum coccineum]